MRDASETGYYVDPGEYTPNELRAPERGATFRVAYAPALAQYVVECGAWRGRIVPTVRRANDGKPYVAADADGAIRAKRLCEALRRIFLSPVAIHE